MKTKYILTLIVPFLLFTNKTIFAQNSTLYNMHVLHQSRIVNPANIPNCKFYLDLPTSSIFLNQSVSALTLNSVFKETTINGEQVKLIDPEYIIDQLPRVTYINTNVTTNLIGFGVGIRNSFFSFNSGINASNRLSFDKTFFELYKGNGSFTGDDNAWNLTGLGLLNTIYWENKIGFATKLTPRLTVGLNAKLLIGLANVDATQTDVLIYTDPDNFHLTLKTDVNIKASAPVELTFTDSTFIPDFKEPDFEGYEISDYIDLVKTGNRGWAFDFGAQYQFSKRIRFTASITDLGYIRWKNNAYNLTSKGEYVFKGIDLAYIQDTDSFLTQLTDTLEATFIPQSGETSYSTALTANLYLGANFIVGKNLDLGVLTRTAFYNKRMYPALTLSANAHLGKGFALSGSYSMMNGTYNNLGLGFALKLAFIQFYLVSDNLSLAIDPKKSNSVNLRTGLNFVFGCKKTQRVMEDTSF